MPPKKPNADAGRALQALKADLKARTPARLYLFHGEESYLKDYYLGRLRALLIPAGFEAFNLKTLDGKTCSALDIAQAVDCLPMMAENTMVIVNDFDLYGAPEAERDKLIDIFNDLPEYLCLVFVYDLVPYKADSRTKLHAAIKKAGQVVEFPRQSQGDLTDWIARRFKATGHSIDNREAQYLIFRCGDLMNTLASEIGKIGAYAKGQRVTREDIDAVSTPQLDAVVFDLTDALSGRNYEAALTSLGELLNMREAPALLLATMAKHLRQLYAARVALEAHRTVDDFIALWGLHAFPAGKLMQAARKVERPWCKNALDRCAKAASAMRNNYGDEADILTQLVLELAHG